MESGVVISGMAAKLPESDNLKEFSDNLYNKVNMLTVDDRRWEPGLYGIPKLMGKLKELNKFDHTFFGVHARQAHNFDPQARILLELAYESIIDAGYHPDEFKGREVGVYVGSGCSETDEWVNRDVKKLDGYGLIGTSRCMFSNRISYTFDFKGPSVTVDTACSSSAMALHMAATAIKNGECEAALVAGSNITLRPSTSLCFVKLNMLSPDGVSKTFDASCNGYGRSEAVLMFFLQKTEMTRRRYATIVHISTNTDGWKEEGVTFPSHEVQQNLLEKVYKECKLDTLKVSYVEAHGTGTPVGDPIEMLAITNNFCKGRTEPLLVGAVKSNMGHPEAASGLCSVTKVIIAMENSLIPPNLHFQTPNPAIPALQDGRVKIVTESTPWSGEYAAFSSFGFGGVNVHAVLRAEPKKQITPSSSLPQLVFCSGRTEDCVNYVLDFAEQKALSRDFFALWHKTVFSTPQSKPFRGYRLLNENKEATALKMQSPTRRPLWYVFSGMGSQWPKMARQLMEVEVFANTIHKCADVLKKYDLDLIDLVTNDVPAPPRSIVPVFVSIAAVQCALVDVLNALGLKPDGIVGHSTGEMGCAYADGCFTLEEFIIAAYLRGIAVEESNLPAGSMAAVGMSWTDAHEDCPKGIFVACDNAEDSVTISGKPEDLRDYITNLKSRNIFAKEVNSCGYGFHCELVQSAVARLRNDLQKLLTNPKKRSKLWISSSYVEKEWILPEAQMADSEYFTHNFINPNRFYEAMKHVPPDAVTVEIGPHHLLQAILKRSLGPEADFIGLMKRNANNVEQLMTCIGKLYNLGYNPDIEKLYPEVKFPVPRGTPMISPLVKWNHSETWDCADWRYFNKQSEMTTEISVGNVDSPERYMLGHNVDGRCLFPATGYIELVWRAFAERKSKNLDSMSVTFEGVKILRATVLSKTTPTKFIVDITNSLGDFEVSEGGMAVCSGRIAILEDSSTLKPENSTYRKSEDLKSADIYKELKLRGYEYDGEFKGILESDLEGTRGLLKWTGNWVTFLDTILQFTLVGSTRRSLSLPTSIQNITIDLKAHKIFTDQINTENEAIPVFFFKNTSKCVSGGVEFRGVKTNFAPRHQSKQDPVLEQYKFIPYRENSALSQTDREYLEKYILACSIKANQILNVRRGSRLEASKIMNGCQKPKVENNKDEIEEALLDSFQKTSSDDHALFKYLSEVLIASPKSDADLLIKTCSSNYLLNMDRDVLFQSLLKEYVLRPLLDIVLENSSGKTLEIAEVSGSHIPLSFSINDHISKHSGFHPNYSIAHTRPDETNFDNPQFNIVATDDKLSFNFENVDLFLLKYLNSKKEYQKVLENVSRSVKDGAFIICIERTREVSPELLLTPNGEAVFPIRVESELEDTFRKLKLTVICKKSDALSSTMYLLRKATNIDYSDSVITISDNNHEVWLNELKEKMAAAQTDSNKKRIWLVSKDSDCNGILGLTNCLRLESAGSCLRCVLGSKGFNNSTAVHQVKQNIMEADLVMNVFKNGEWGSYRHLQVPEDRTKTDTSRAYLNILTKGDLSSFAWIESPLKHVPVKNEDALCQVYYAPLNFKDVMMATGKLTADVVPGAFALQDCILGLEYSGRLLSGRRVMGLVPVQGMATTVLVDAEFLWDVPDSWSLEEASTVPCAYATAYYSLVVRGRIKKGEKILVHSGSGGVGQAAIAIALSMDCEVFTTVGTMEKREFLKKRFPALKEKSFCNSRDITFERHILEATSGRGVDIILNSLTEEKLKASLNCLAEHGRFLEIGKYDIFKDSALGMSIFLNNISFQGINLDPLFETTDTNVSEKKALVNLINEGIASGTVRPLNAIIFDHHQAEQAFRYMASGKHIGKVVLKIRNEEPQRNAIPKPLSFKAFARTSMNPENSYIIIGGLGGLGLELCQWMIERGAKHIVLTSRSGIRTGYQKLCLRRWKKEHKNVVTSTLDATKFEDAKSLIELASSIKPVAGIFNLALVLRDALLANQTVQLYKEVLDSKVQSTVNLNSVSRDLCSKLEYFVCFSSVSCGRGNIGQSNYGYANSAMERICEARVRDGLHGLAIQWGAVADVGILQEISGSEDLVIGGTVPQRIQSLLNVLDSFLVQKHPVMSSYVKHQPLESGHARSSKLNVLATISNIFGIKNSDTINPEITLGDMGMDSLMGVEVKQFLENSFDLVLDIPTIRQLKVKDLKLLESGGQLGAQQSDNLDDENQLEIKFERGFFSYLQTEELVPKQTLVKLNSSKDGVPLFLLHPLEGTVEMLKELANSIKVPVYGIQCTADAYLDCMESLASWYWDQMCSLSLGNSIHLAGYSFGGSVAIAMAQYTESKRYHSPQVDKLIMLDSSPALVGSTLTGLAALKEAENRPSGESHILDVFVNQFTPTNSTELISSLIALPSFDARISHAMDKIIASYSHLRKEDLTACFNLYCQKVLISTWLPSRPTRKNILLLKASDCLASALELGENYNLEDICKGVITAHEVEGNHTSFLNNEKTAKLINDICNS